MGVAVVGAVLAACGLALFARHRPRARQQLTGPVAVPDRAAAVRAAADHAGRLTGIAVTGWPAYAVPSSDAALLHQAHHLGITNQVLPLLLRWGLLCGWRVRFCGARDTIVVGLGASGSVNYLLVSGRRRDAVTALGCPTPPDRMPSPIVPNDVQPISLQHHDRGGAVPRAAVPRAGAALATEVVDDGASATFIEEGPSATVSVTVESWNDHVVGVTTRAAITAEGIDAVRDADLRGRRCQRLAMTGMVLALLLAAVALIATEGGPSLEWSLGLGFVAFAAVMVGEPSMFPRMVVHEFDGREPLSACRYRHLRQTLLAALLNGGFVTGGVAVGGGLLKTTTAGPWPPLTYQVGIGALVACVWLGLTATAYSSLVHRGRLATTAELPPQLLKRLGYSWREVVVASLQSSIGEEVLYRLVIVSLAWHLFDQPLAGVLVAAALWSATHDAGDVRPRWPRFLELFVLGCVLGLVLVFAGLVAAIIAHLVFNVLLLGWPLLWSELPRWSPRGADG